MEDRAVSPPEGWSVIDEGDVLSVPGLTGAAVRTGVKESNDLDLVLLGCQETMVARGVFTQNRMPAAPVTLCRERLLESPGARCLVINSGNANAMTGARGMEDAVAMAARTEKHLGEPALVMSTGVIGVPLPLPKVLDGIDEAAGQMSADAGDDMARAIMTTDTRPKRCALTHQGPGGVVTVGGMAKGSGMIHPNMATMLCVVATDAQVVPKTLQSILTYAVDRTFHEITVDGDTSTNDGVILLARPGQGEVVHETSDSFALLRDGITAVMRHLAEAIVRDGEGVSRVAHVRVTGADTEEHARIVARSIAGSSLVKTALAGGDPNWGRILAAAANTDVPVTPEGMVLTLQGIRVFADGLPLSVDQTALDDAFFREEVDIELRLGMGSASANMLTTDLTKRYVEINSEYTT